MDLSIFIALRKLSDKNEKDFLSDEIFELMKPIIRKFNLNVSEIYNQWKDYEILKYSHCNDENELKFMSESMITRDLVQIIPNIGSKIEWLDTLPQPVQRTPEWYSYRHTVITASSMSQVFESKSKYNTILKEKVLPANKGSFPSTPALRHGIRNEPIAQSIYEMLTDTKVSEYGCIKHPSISYLGASPDGIVTSSKCDKKLGHMLEIKCLFSRQLTGIPLYKYWVQCQTQLEVCQMEYCDFFECKLNENLSEEEFYTKINDGTHKEFYGIVIEYKELNSETKENKRKWIYSSINLNESEFKEWTNTELHRFGNDDPNICYSQSYYWELSEYSNRLIKRNRDWFKYVRPKIDFFWNEVEQKRKRIENDVTGEIKRDMFPDKKPKLEAIKLDICLIDDEF
jgi:putative phage-type endonuclease